MQTGDKQLAQCQSHRALLALIWATGEHKAHLFLPFERKWATRREQRHELVFRMAESQPSFFGLTVMMLLTPFAGLQVIAHHEAHGAEAQYAKNHDAAIHDTENHGAETQYGEKHDYLTYDDENHGAKTRHAEIHDAVTHDAVTHDVATHDVATHDAETQDAETQDAKKHDDVSYYAETQHA